MEPSLSDDFVLVLYMYFVLFCRSSTSFVFFFFLAAKVSSFGKNRQDFYGADSLDNRRIGKNLFVRTSSGVSMDEVLARQ